MRNKTLSIMFTDIKGFTSRTSSTSRSDMIEMLKTHDDILTPVIIDYGGTLIKTIGDAFLVTFESPTDAVLSGIALQEKLQEFNESLPDDKKIEIRIAINTGEVSLKDGDIYGEAVNIAARVEGLADANQIFFTEATYLSMNKSEVPSAEIGYRLLKGIPEKIKVYKVLQEHNKQKVKLISAKIDEKKDTTKVEQSLPTEPVLKTAGIFRRFIAFAIDIILLFCLAGFLLGNAHKSLKYSMVQLKTVADQAGIKKIKAKNISQYPKEIQENLKKIIAKKIEVDATKKKLIFIFFIFYSTLSLWIWKKTLGKKIMGLKVVTHHGQKIGFRDAISRSFLYYISFLVFGLGFFWAIFSKNHFAWHDKLSDTMVVPIEN